MRLTVSQQFTFDAAHTLDRCNSSRRTHGHTYHAEISFHGERDPQSAMVCDLAELRAICDGIREQLDHQLLDEVNGLGPATLENLCLFIWSQGSRSDRKLCRVKLWRADGGSCTLELEDSDTPLKA
jgi:6-pyruvoyltetrahydropterin/6-carboxytetrahydropterin synthase